MPGRLISRTPPFEGGRVGANPAPAANFGKSSFDRSVVKQDHVWPTPRNRRGSTFPSDHFHPPRGVIRSASVSETGGPGAKPGEAANFVFNKEQTPHHQRVWSFAFMNILT